MYRHGDSSRPMHTNVKLEELDGMGNAHAAASASSVYSQIKDLLFLDCSITSPSEFEEHDNGQQQQQQPNSNYLWGFPAAANDTSCSAALQMPAAAVEQRSLPAPPPLLHPENFTPVLQIPKAPATGGTSKDQAAKAKRRSTSKFSTDPQSVAARLRRKRISERFKILQKLVPGGTKMDTASMLDEAITYVKFLKQQISLHELVVNGGGLTGGGSNNYHNAFTAAGAANEDQMPATSWSSSVSEGSSTDNANMAVELDFQHIQIMKIWNEQQ